MSKYAIGIDFGTLSGRILVLDIENHKECCTRVVDYPHGVIDKQIGEFKLLDNWALQDPKDYLLVLSSIENLLKENQINVNDILSIGIAFTSSTILPVNDKGLPLCFDEKFKNKPHAYVKLWKHHAAQNQADRINKVANETNQSFIKRYGGIVSSEWQLPKIMEIMEEDEEVFNATSLFIEAGDWIVQMLTGEFYGSICQAGYKGLYHDKEKYPSPDFLKLLDSKLVSIYESKVLRDIKPVGSTAGVVNERGSKISGLRIGTNVSVAMIDAHSAVPATGISKSNEMLLIMGTSTCHLINHDKEVFVPGISGYVYEGMLPNLFGYEAGQAAVGDIFNWFVENYISDKYLAEADKKNMTIHEFLTDKCINLLNKETKLVALDWWNGCRTPLGNSNLTGVITGLNLHTAPEEIYLALIEATAFGTKKIIETFSTYGIPIEKIVISGGIASKNQMITQIYANVLEREIIIANTMYPGALGASIYSLLSIEPFSLDVVKTIQTYKSKNQTIIQPEFKSEYYNCKYSKYIELFEFFRSKY